MRKNSTTVGQLREALSGVPDDVEVWVDRGVPSLEAVMRVRHTRVVDAISFTKEVDFGADDNAGKPVVIIGLTR